MGNCCLPIRFRRRHSGVKPKSVTLLLLGLDNAGKTTVAKRLAGEPVDSVVATVGFSVIVLRQRGCHVSIYDLGGGPQIRDIWPRYYADAHGVVFVADSLDTERMEECREVLEAVLRNEQISGKPVLLLANKQDVEGALDEIDVVDRLNLERVVNEQKCPTLVELCSALDFSKKMDVGIENGYKWLIRSIIRDYPSLNSRVLRDLAKQEAENKVQAITDVHGGRSDDERTPNRPNGSPFRSLRRTSVGERFGHVTTAMPPSKAHAETPFQDAKGLLNGYLDGRRKSRPGIRTVAVIPGLVEEDTHGPDRRTNQVPRFLRQEAVPEPSADCLSNEFFFLDKFQTDLELLNDVPNHSFRNFLVRPKSSGARLYGARTEKNKTHRRKPLRKGNKTGPSPFTDISNARPGGGLDRARNFFEEPRRGSLRTPGLAGDSENVNPFEKSNAFEMKAAGESKSVPNSRRNSVVAGRRRRYSMANGKPPGGERFPSGREILLDVTKLSN